MASVSHPSVLPSCSPDVPLPDQQFDLVLALDTPHLLSLDSVHSTIQPRPSTPCHSPTVDLSMPPSCLTCFSLLYQALTLALLLTRLPESLGRPSLP